MQFSVILMKYCKKEIKTHYEKAYFFVMIYKENFLCKYHKKKGLSLLTICR